LITPIKKTSLKNKVSAPEIKYQVEVFYFSGTGHSIDETSIALIYSKLYKVTI